MIRRLLLAIPFLLAVALADDRSDKVDQAFAAFTAPGSPGCALGVVQNGEYIYQHGYGLGSIELNVPLTSQSVFYMGSVSKQFTAAAVVLAAEQGKLSLDDDVRKWFPELRDYSSGGGKTITLRHMLHHTSGIRDVLALLDLAGGHAEDVHPVPEFIDLIARQKALNFEPGAEYLYSNSNFVLLAEAVHRATGKTFAQFTEENIFQPLGMTHTRFFDDHRVVLPNRVAAYSPRQSGGFQINWSTNFDKVGDGGLMSSVEDLLLWDRNFYANKLGKGTLLTELQTRGVLNSGKPIDYALGLVISKYRGLPVVEHGGALFGYRTEILRFPEQKFSVITLCNLATANPGGLAYKVADIYLEKQLAPPPASPQNKSASVVDLAPYAGTYRYAAEHDLLTTRVREGALETRGGRYFPAGPNRLMTESGNELTFDPVTKQLTLRLVDTPPRTFERYERETPNDTQLAEYAGSYYSDELLATYKVSAKDGKLSVQVGWNEPRTAEMTVRDEFQGTSGGMLAFTRGANGQINGMQLFAGRVRNIAFVRK